MSVETAISPPVYETPEHPKAETTYPSPEPADLSGLADEDFSEHRQTFHVATAVPASAIGRQFNVPIASDTLKSAFHGPVDGRNGGIRTAIAAHNMSITHGAMPCTMGIDILNDRDEVITRGNAHHVQADGTVSSHGAILMAGQAGSVQLESLVPHPREPPMDAEAAKWAGPKFSAEATMKGVRYMEQPDGSKHVLLPVTQTGQPGVPNPASHILEMNIHAVTGKKEAAKYNLYPNYDDEGRKLGEAYMVPEETAKGILDMLKERVWDGPGGGLKVRFTPLGPAVAPAMGAVKKSTARVAAAAVDPTVGVDGRCGGVHPIDLQLHVGQLSPILQAADACGAAN